MANNKTSAELAQEISKFNKKLESISNEYAGNKQCANLVAANKKLKSDWATEHGEEVVQLIQEQILLIQDYLEQIACSTLKNMKTHRLNCSFSWKEV